MNPRRHRQHALAERFGRRALGVGLAAVFVAFAALVVSRFDPHHLFA